MTFLEITDLRVAFGRRQRIAVDGISLQLEQGERLGLIGQSGSGKSVTALAVLGLLPEHATVTGSIKLGGQELVGLSERQLGALRGSSMSMVFQEPMTALDPTMKVGKQVAEAITLHQKTARTKATDTVLGWLERVGLEDSTRVWGSYPHELSGGQRQRVLIAMAMANRPGLVVCDEPTTALDSLVQRQILDLLNDELTGRAALFVSHDIAAVKYVCPRVAVMLDGEIVETGSIDDVINAPKHAYTKQLVEAAKISEMEPGRRLPTMSEEFTGGAS